MSDVARYVAAGDGVVKTDPAGPLVKWNDYARLQAEVERLREAGDVMAEALRLNDDVFDNQEKKEAQAAWNAAKEDRQP